MIASCCEMKSQTWDAFRFTLIVVKSKAICFGLPSRSMQRYQIRKGWCGVQTKCDWCFAYLFWNLCKERKNNYITSCEWSFPSVIMHVLSAPHRRRSRWCACPDRGVGICAGPSAWGPRGSCTPPRRPPGRRPLPATWSCTVGWSKTCLRETTQHRGSATASGLLAEGRRSPPAARDSLGWFLQPPAELPLLQLP